MAGRDADTARAVLEDLICGGADGRGWGSPLSLCTVSAARSWNMVYAGRERGRERGVYDAPAGAACLVSRFAECPYCGDMMISIVSLPFVDGVEEAELTASWEV